jgi:hypothetical protein
MTDAEQLAEWAKKGAAMGDCGKMCTECAFKKGSITQVSEPHNVEAAKIALMWDGQFNCHVNDYQDAGKPCVGFLYAKQYWNNVAKGIENR